jgi:hypothetical protein
MILFRASSVAVQIVVKPIRKRIPQLEGFVLMKMALTAGLDAFFMY